MGKAWSSCAFFRLVGAELLDAMLRQGFAVSQHFLGHRNLERVSEWSREGLGTCLEALVGGKFQQQCGGERGRASVLYSSTLGCRGGGWGSSSGFIILFSMLWYV